MSGHAKRLYNKHIIEYVRTLKEPFKEVANLMKIGFTEEEFVETFKECYLHLWQDISDKHRAYQKADERLVKQGKKRRYKFPKPFNFVLYKADQIIKNTRSKHENGITPSQENIEQKKKELKAAAQKEIEQRKVKLEQKLTFVQNVRPEYSGFLLGKYLRHRRTHPEDVDTCYRYLQEASKYKCRDTIDLFQKVNAAERNYHLRHFAFITLQHFGIKEVQLRKNPKGKARPGDKTVPKMINTPKELLDAIYNSQLEQRKQFDLFLSHSSSNVDELLQLKTRLNLLGINVYIDWVNDREQLQRTLTSQETAKVIIERIRMSKAVAFIHTAASDYSQWTPWELGYAYAIGKKICVLQLGEVTRNPAYLEIYDKVVIENDKIQVITANGQVPIKEWINNK